MSTKKPRWTSTDTEFIERNWKSMTDGQLADHIGCSSVRVERKRKDLGLLRKRPITTAEIRHVGANYRFSYFQSIGQDIGRSDESVRYMLKMYLHASSPHGMRKREAA